MLTTDLSPHLALVTGGTGGIGKATCLALASLGCSIAVHYNSAADTAKALVEELRAKDVKAEAFQADLRDYGQVRAFHSAVVSSLGPPTILFNNAGLTLKHGVQSISEISIEQFEETWRANCGSAFLLTQLCLPAMEKGGDRGDAEEKDEEDEGVEGKWKNVALNTDEGARSSKSALHGLIHWLAQAYSKKGITVNGVAPALIQDTALLPGDNKELAKKIPIGRLGRPEEIAETVVWMVKTGYVTNKVVGVDGGLFAQ